MSIRYWLSAILTSALSVEPIGTILLWGSVWIRVEHRVLHIVGACSRPTCHAARDLRTREPTRWGGRAYVQERVWAPGLAWQGCRAVCAGRLTKKHDRSYYTTVSKGDDTRLAILEVALAQASESGFESLTIGSLAERVGISKSGLFAHFGSREELQVAAIEAAAARFTETVFIPALKAKRGLPRLRALFDHWLDWTTRSGLTHGCPMQAAAVEFDDHPGAVRDAVSDHFSRLERELAHAVELAIGQGHLRADLDAGQFAFEMMGVILAYYHSARLFERTKAESRAHTAFERLIVAASPAP